MNKVFVFDMGGVVVRDFHIAPELFAYLHLDERMHGFSDTAPEIQEALQNHGSGKISEEIFWKIFSQLSGIAVSENLLGKFFHPVFDDETKVLIDSLRRDGHRVVCGTNTIDSHYRIHIALQQYAIFDFVYASHLMGASKPDRSFYTYILEKENIEPHEMFFTDDLPENVLAAKKEGINSYIYENAEKLRKDIRK